MNILVAWFSATGNTARLGGVIADSFEDFGASVDTLDVTSYLERNTPCDLDKYDAVVIGAPIHVARAPALMRDWLKTLDGKQKKAAMFFTYGGFGVHPTRQILQEQNFITVSSAEFLGAHTFNWGGWKAMEERPNRAEFDLAKEFVEATYKRFTGEEPAILGELELGALTDEQLDAAESGRFKIVSQLPTRYGESCGLCGACEAACPTGAMDASSGEADPESCIACLACVVCCPVGALQINDCSASWQVKLAKEGATEESLKEKQSRVYL